MKSRISVIIPAYNEARHIKNCLESLSQQTLLPYEIIVIDDGSTDDTLSVLKKFPASNFEFRILRAAHRGAGAARNLGARQTKGNILVFVDADMEFSPEFIDQLTAPILQGKAKGTFSKNELVKNWYNPWARAWSFCLGLKDHHLIPPDYPQASPVFRAILKSEFNQAGGFDESRGYDDDWSLSEKLGYQAALAKNAIYYHYNPDSPLEIFRQARWRAHRQYKLGVLGKLFNYLKVNLIVLRPPFEPISLLAKIVFISGTQIGILASFFSPKASK